MRDAQGRITSKTSTVLDNPNTPSSYTVSYSYAAGELAGMTYPSGLAVSYQRTAGRITGVTVREPGTARKPKPTIPFISSLTHTALGQPQSWTWSTGDTAARTFDTDGRMTATEFSGYGYDAAGRITSITQELWAQRTTTLELYRTPLTWTAGYDNRDHLTSFTRAGASTHYTYDANSNRLTSIDKTTSDTDIDGQFTEQDAASTTSQVSLMDGDSNRLLGFTQTLTTMSNGKVKSVVTAPVNYIVNANGSMTSDGLREFDYDAANRLAKVTVSKDGEAARVVYLTNAMGQRVFKSVPQAEQTLPDETTLDAGFIAWLKKSFGWLFSASTTTTGAGLGTAYVYGDGPIPAWAMLGEYDNGSAVGKGRTEYIWLLTQDGQALPVGMYRNGKFYAVHADHLGTPRLITDEANKPVWQWPYSAFGNNTPTGVLQSTPNPKQAITNQPVLLKATKPIEMNLRFPGQYFDAETGLFYNGHRHYCARCGRYIQSDSIGLDGGINTFGYAAGAPTSYTDPTGQFVPLLLAPLLAPAWAPALAYGTAALATAAAVAMTLAPPPDYSPWSPDPEKNKEFIRDRDGVNDVKPVPYKDPSKPTCDEIRERIRFLEDIVARRVALTNKWYSGVFNPGHAGRVDTLRRDIDKLRARLARGDCAPC